MPKISKKIKEVLGSLRKKRKITKKRITKKELQEEKPISLEREIEEVKREIGVIQEEVKKEEKKPFELPQELPLGYGEDKIVLQTRDPWWIHAYWEVTEKTKDKLKETLGEEFWRAKKILRCYDVSNIIFDGKNAHRYFDIEIKDYVNNWYIETGCPGTSWIVDLGLLLPDNKFILITRSNVVSTPIPHPSPITDEEWMVPEEVFARLYGAGLGLQVSSPVGKVWEERLKREGASFAVASPGIFSLMSPVKKVERGFWLVVNTELIVYGATQPDAKVTIQGRPLSLRSDGTFSLRFHLPDGRQVIPVRAVSADGLEERTITPIVTKETK